MEAQRLLVGCAHAGEEEAAADLHGEAQPRRCPACAAMGWCSGWSWPAMLGRTGRGVLRLQGQVERAQGYAMRSPGEEQACQGRDQGCNHAWLQEMRMGCC